MGAVGQVSPLAGCQAEDLDHIPCLLALWADHLGNPER